MNPLKVWQSSNICK